MGMPGRDGGRRQHGDGCREDRDGARADASTDPILALGRCPCLARARSDGFADATRRARSDASEDGADAGRGGRFVVTDPRVYALLRRLLPFALGLMAGAIVAAVQHMGAL